MQRGFSQYQRQEHLFSTRTAEGFVALCEGQKHLLWIQRFPFAFESEEAEIFKKRILAFEKLGIAPKIKEYGLDSRGVAYVVFEPFEFANLFSVAGGFEERRESFEQILKIVARANLQGVVLGDLCEDSFVLSGSRVFLVGLMGVIETGAKKTAVLPPAEIFEFLAPEQIGGGVASSSSDVYALGVYGYRLFVGKPVKQASRSLGFVSSNNLEAPSLASGCPKWVDNLLGYALQPSFEARFKDASSMLLAMHDLSTGDEIVEGRKFWKQEERAVGQAKESQRPSSVERTTFVMDLPSEPEEFYQFQEMDFGQELLKEQQVSEEPLERSRNLSEEKASSSEKVNFVLPKQNRKEEFLSEEDLRILEENLFEEKSNWQKASSFGLNKRLMFGAIALAAVVVFCVVASRVKFFSRLSGVSLGVPSLVVSRANLPVPRVNPELYQALEYARRSNASDGSEEEASKALVANLKASALDQLFLVVVQEEDAGFYAAFEQYLTKRLYSSGFNQLNVLLKDWVSKLRQSRVESANISEEKSLRLDVILFLLQTLNVDLGRDKIREMLEGVFAVDPLLTQEFVAAVALDRAGEFADFLCLKQSQNCSRTESGEVDVASLVRSVQELQDLKNKLQL